MSAGNVELVQSLFRRVNPGDLTDLTEFWAPDCRVTPAEGWPEPGPFVGRDAVFRQFARLFEDFSESAFEDICATSADAEWVLVTWRWRTRGAASGLEAKIDLAAALHVRDGRIIQGHFRWTAEQALEAVGLDA